MTRALAGLLLAGVLACEPRREPLDSLRNATWIDLSHDFSAETIYWPTARPFKLEVVSAQRTPGCPQGALPRALWHNSFSLPDTPRLT